MIIEEGNRVKIVCDGCNKILSNKHKDDPLRGVYSGYGTLVNCKREPTFSKYGLIDKGGGEEKEVCSNECGDKVRKKYWGEINDRPKTRSVSNKLNRERKREM